MKHILLFGVAGLISGFLTNITINDYYASLIISYSPGWIFGIIMAIALYFLSHSSSNIRIWKLLIWIIFSTLAYFSAVQATMYHAIIYTNIYGNDFENLLSFFIGGSVGALILFTSLVLLFRLRFVSLLYAIVIGGVLGAVGIVLDSYYKGEDYPILYLIWQTGIALLIGMLIDKQRTVKQSLPR